MSTPAFILGTANSRGTKQNRKPAYKQDLMASASFCQSYTPKNTLPAFTPSPPWHKTRSSPATPTESGIYFCLRAYKIDSYASASDLKCSEGLRVRIVPLLCTEREKKKKKEKRWWWLDWTHSNWWVPWPEAWVRMGLLRVCVCACSSQCTLAPCRLNHCNGALMPEELNGRGHSQKMARKKNHLKANRFYVWFSHWNASWAMRGFVPLPLKWSLPARHH